MNKKVSVIIPTFNGKEKIDKVLASLETQIYKDFEVIIVNDGSTDDTCNYLNNRERKLSHFKVLQQENKGRSGARNSGANFAKGEYLIFFDDDVVFSDKNLIGNYVSLFERKDCFVIVGSLEPIFSVENSDFQQYCKYLNEKWTDTVSEGVLKKPYITACNFGISRAFFHKMGGFDNRLKDAEDFDLAVKIFEAGYPIFFNNQLIVCHQLYGSFRDLINRQFEYRKANEKLLVINPVVKKYRSHLKYSRSKRVFLRIFSLPFLPKIIDKHTFKFLPAKLKFKLYDWVLEANIFFRFP